jgi:TRAP transporter TAXI family solute receptor
MSAARLLGALALAAVACSRPSTATARRLSIATGGTGGVYYVLGGALARVLSRDLPGLQATAEVTSASIENLHFVADGSADLGFSLADSAHDAAQGRGKFPEPLPIVALASLYDNVTHIVTRDEAGLASVTDLRGHRVSTGSPNSGTEVIAERILEAAGLDPTRDLRRERLGAAESAAALKDGRLDAFFWSGGLPTASVVELAATPGTRLRLLSDAPLVPKMVAAHGPHYGVARIPDGLYPGTKGVEASSVRNVLVAHRDLPEDLAYQITRLLFAKKDELAAAHPMARALDPKAAVLSPVPLHPGAIRYYKEQGVWPSPSL